MKPEIGQIRSRRLLPPQLGALLEFTDGEEKGRKVPLLLARTVLGRKFGDVLVRDIKVSATHAALEYRGDRFYIVDLDSANGTFVDTQKVKSTPMEPGQAARIGLTEFRLVFDLQRAVKLTADRPPEISDSEGGLTELLSKEFFRPDVEGMPDATVGRLNVPVPTAMEFVALFGPIQGKRFSFDKKSVLIGRVQADLNVPDADVSRKHAIVEVQDNGQIILRDLASRNGTFVNDARITNRVLSKGDRIRMGNTTLLFSGGGA